MILSKRPDIDRFLKDPPAEIRAALIFGRDRGGVRERADKLAARIVPNPDDPFDVALLAEGDIDKDGAKLEDELASQSMMGGRRLVRLRMTEGKVGAERAAAEALTAHAEGRYNPDAFFLIEGGDLSKSSVLRKAADAAKGAASIVIYEDETGDVARLVREALAADKVSLTAEGLEMFAARLPKERGVARQEIERLILFLGPGSGMNAGPADLVDFLGVEPEASLAEAAVDAFGGRMSQAQGQMRRAWAEGEAGPTAVRAIGMHLAKLRRALVLMANGAGAQEAAKASGVFWKSEREFLRQARSWRLSDLDALQPEVVEADKACKTAGSPDAVIAERLALGIAGKARRLGL